MNGLRQHHNLAIVFLTLIFCAYALLGCTTVEATSKSLSAEQPLYGEIFCQQATEDSLQCSLLVDIGAFEQDLKATVSVDVTGGIRFDGDNGRLSASDNGHRASTGEINIPYRETRAISFPFAADQNETLSGAYVIAIHASGPGPDSERFHAYHTVFVKAGAADARIVTSADKLDAEFGAFVQGSGDLAYLISIDRDDPAHGQLYVRLQSRSDAFEPELIVSVEDGVAFEQTSANFLAESGEVRQKLGVVRATGYRIVPLPFALVPASLGGQRVITAGVRQNETVSALELAPVCLRLYVDQAPNGPQITTGVIEPENLLAQNTEGQVPNSTLRGGGISEPANDQGGEHASIAWNQVISGFSGTRWDAYQLYIAGTVDMEWETFRDMVLLFNPKLHQSGFVFQADERYVLPGQQ